MLRMRSSSLGMRMGLPSALLLSAAFSSGCKEDSNPVTSTAARTFQVTIENISDVFVHALSGVFDTPEGAQAPAAIGPGQAYSFTFGALPGQKLSFATMFVHSNDLFFAPDGAGIALFDGSGLPLSGDVTSQVALWDAGTETNMEPGIGADQAPRQSAANSGSLDANTTVRLVSDGFPYPGVASVIQVTITHNGGNEFTARIKNVSTSTTLVTSNNDMLSVPMAPGVWVVHTQDNPLFTPGSPDVGAGLEGLAEDGSAATLGASLALVSGLQGPLAPGVWAVHSAAAPLFANGSMDRGDGLEALSEDGSPAALSMATASRAGVISSGVFDTPTSSASAGPALPGAAYSFMVTAEPGQSLSFATMLVQSNDLFFAPADMGIALFASGTAVNGDVTAQVMLWDAGTESNQFPGVGSDQAPRQAGANTGAADSNNTVRPLSDGYPYPATNALVRVTVTPVP